VNYLEEYDTHAGAHTHGRTLLLQKSKPLPLGRLGTFFVGSTLRLLGFLCGQVGERCV
jgi:hypothetical protein